MTSTPKLLLSSPADVLAAVPYLIGFHPADSLVVAGFTGSGLRLSTRWDLPVEPGALDGLVPLLQREQVSMTILAGYGTGPLVTPAVEEATRLLRGAGIDVAESLRADDGWYWSYTCTRVGCCPAEGTPYDPVSSPIAAEAIVNGLVALPDRRSLERSVAPYGGLGRVSMRQVTGRVAAEVEGRLARADRPDEVAAAFVADGLARVRAAIDVYACGDRLGDEEAARLGFDLAVIRVRDEAWALLDDRDAHLTLWKDLTRRLELRFVAPAASLLAAAAWRAGECALAGMALERALAADPGYSMAILLRQALTHLLSPGVLRDRMPTPKELDDQMGRPRMSWLVPLLALLREEPAALAG